MTKRKKKSSATGAQADRQPWHLRLEVFRRQAVQKSPRLVTVSLCGWELHLGYRPGQVDEAGAPAPWSLSAHPIVEKPDYHWLGEAGVFLGVPGEERPTAPPGHGPAVVSWTWDAEAPVVYSGPKAKGEAS